MTTHCCPYCCVELHWWSLDDKMAFVIRDFGTQLKEMYGGKVEWLRKIRASINPDDVMGLTGFWKFQRSCKNM